jgi:hypothetical protein
MLARLAGATLSFAGLTAFRWAGPRAPTAPAAPKWDDHFELAVDLTIAAQQGYRYHRPYVAVWVEDAAGRPVRTLSLWVSSEGRGRRYIRELRRWFSSGDQVAAGGPDLVATVSSATRLPGRYTVAWDGRDDRGRAVEQGTYRVYIEAAREHGSYQLMQKELTLGAKPVAVTLAGNEEIQGASIEYRRKK